MKNQRNILVTAALPYANAPLHIGHMVEYLQADFWVRFQRLQGHQCRYFCADDTHGTPIFLNAKKQGIAPEDLVSQSFERNQKDFADFGVEFTHYSSTNSASNKALCSDFFLKMEKSGHILSKEIDQLYCAHDKMFLPDRLVKGTCPKCKAEDQWGDSCDVCGATYSTSEVLSPACSLCGNTPETRSSEHLFVNLDHFREFLSTWVPEHNSSEVTSKLQDWLDGELRPWDISRDAPYFGFEIPGHPEKYFYVWMDAPIGYIATTKEWHDSRSGDVLEDWGPKSSTEIYHFIGKDIVYFHSLFWPAMLKAANMKTPNGVFAHGFLTVNGKKMSKSKGTFIKARTYLDLLNPTYLRYYYACKLSSGMDDIDLNLEDFSQRVNSDLVGKYINLGSRSAKILNSHFNGQLGRREQVDTEGHKILTRLQDLNESILNLYENREFSKAMVEIRNIVDEANRYFDGHTPWKTVKTDNKEAALSSLTVALLVFRNASILISPILPTISEKVALLFKKERWHWEDLNDLGFSETIGTFSPLLKRVDPVAVRKLIAE